MPSLVAYFYNLVFRCISHDHSGQEIDYEKDRKRSYRNPVKCPKGVVVIETSLNGLYAEKISKPGNTNGIILYIHGGGFTIGSAKERRSLCQYLTNRFGFDSLTFDYRLAPENKWPSQLDDCEKAYRGLLNLGTLPQSIVVMGESAGGMLSLSLALRLKEKNLPQPRAIAAFSPCLTMVDTFPSHKANIKTDYMLRDSIEQKKLHVVFEGDLTEQMLRSPEVSPLYGDYAGLPPIFLSASDTEVLFDDSRMLYQKLKHEGHIAEVDVQHGVCHAFQMFYHMPEAKRTLEHAFSFIEQVSRKVNPI